MSARSNSNPSPRTKVSPARFSGTITWIEGEVVEQFKTTNAIVRPDGDIAFDFDSGVPGLPYMYTVVLSRTGTDLFEGQFSGGNPRDATSGKVVCRRYTGASGIALAGLWFEGGGRDEWFAEFFPVSGEAGKT